MTEREKFETELKRIDAMFDKSRDFTYDNYTDTYQCASTNLLYSWFKVGAKAATKAAVPEGWEEFLSSVEKMVNCYYSGESKEFLCYHMRDIKTMIEDLRSAAPEVK